VTLPDRLYDAYVFDLDGTVYLGDALLPAAGETIAALRALGRRTMFLSNNPTRTRGDYVAKLARLGVPTPPTDLLLSSMVLADFLRRHLPEGRLFVVGEEPLCAELREAGFELVHEAGYADAVIASFDRTFDYAKLQVAFDAIRGGARFFATNGDRYCPVPGGGQPDAAAVIAALEACTGKQCEAVVGKPSPYMIEALLSQLGLPAADCLLVGDRLETDISMGVAAGMATALTLTGATTSEALPSSAIQPTYVLRNLGELLPVEGAGLVGNPLSAPRT